MLRSEINQKDLGNQLKSERPFKRTERVANEIQAILGKIQTQFIDLSDLGFVTFTHVHLSPDLKYAKVFFGVIQKQKTIENIQAEMNNHAKAFRKYLGQELRIKYTPELKFYYDDTMDYNHNLDTIFHLLDSDQ